MRVLGADGATLWASEKVAKCMWSAERRTKRCRRLEMMSPRDLGGGGGGGCRGLMGSVISMVGVVLILNVPISQWLVRV